MVLKKRLDYGFNGFQVPAVPRAPRSLRRRDSFKKQVGDGQICAFELLAAVAGKLLQECESSSASSNDAEVKHQLAVGDDAIKQEQQDDENILRTELHAHVSCEESAIVSEHSSQEHNKYILKEFLHVESDAVLERTSTVTNSVSSEKVGTNLKVAIGKNKNAYGISPGKGEGGSPGFGESCGGKIEKGIEKQPEAGGDEVIGLTVANSHSIKNPMGLRIKHSALANSDSKVELPICRNPIPNASFHRHRNDVNLGIRDDDENSYRCKQSSTKLKAFRPSPRVGDRRIRKILTSKYWKVAPKLKEFDFRDTDRETKRVCRNRKTYYSREKFQHDRPFKKRKLFDQSSVVTSDGGVSSETYSNSPGKGMNGDKSDSDDLLGEANGVPSSVRGHQASFQSRDSHVRFSIKSFRVPELFIEVPETATVGSLKRTVMKAVAAILHGGLDVGVLLRGKKVKDDNITLLQTGISHNDNLDTLGFTLEPGSHAPSPLCAEDPPLLLPSDMPQQLTRSPITKLLDSGDSDASSDPSPVVDLGNHVDSDYDFVPSPTGLSTDKTVPESRALVPLPAMNVEALAVVPMNQKTRRSELVQRRTRRPFSVSEVEALVHAVEKLGTGRWRDVKLRAFDNANHRTYVDLKDKWKTLVHTAQISPQQRRGEPVPQELLDRVLAAHSYWSHHQAKHHGKHQAATLKITDNQTEMDVD